MKAMKLSEMEFLLLYEFIEALSFQAENLTNWIDDFTYRLSKKRKSKSKNKSRTTKKQLDEVNKRLSQAGIRLFLTEILVRDSTTKGGSALTWFYYLVPQLKIRNYGFLDMFDTAIKQIAEETADLMVDKGVDYCVNEYLIKYLKNKN